MANCYHSREQALQRARRTADTLAPQLEEDLPREEGMKRYIHPIPCCCPPCPSGCETDLDGVLEALARQHFEECVRSKIYPAARELLASLHRQGIPTAILTSTNSVIARPVAEALGVPEVYGCTLEMIDGRCTGHVAGTYGVGPGKVTIAQEVLGRRGVPLSAVAYYGDSINDRNMLEAVGFPHTVNPSEELRKIAVEKNWPVLNWR